jgi:23S rRNA pseudouridine1911/1915/1917 synthase
METKELTALDLAQQTFKECSKTSLKKWIRMGRLSFNGKVIIKEMTQVKPHHKVELLKKKQSPYPFPVLFEDKDIIVVHKPSFLLSVASLDPNEKNVHSILKKELRPGKVFPVHRLDREVSGPLIFAKSKEAFAKLQEAFYLKEIKREYKALIHGILKESQGTWESLLLERSNYKVASSEENGKHAITHYRVEDVSNEVSLLCLTLDTGRKNQLRVHTSEAGHPIVGDQKYGAEDPEKNLALFAHKLSFLHPMTRQKLYFEVEPPPYFKKLLSYHKLKL